MLFLKDFVYYCWYLYEKYDWRYS